MPVTPVSQFSSHHILSSSINYTSQLIIHKDNTKEILKSLMSVWKSGEKLLIFAS